jgi:hypothetical protein
LKEATFSYEDISVAYRLRQPAKDRRHLVVVFAGVSQGKHDFYGFDGQALAHVPGAVLWIKDSFDGNNAYYLCKDLEFGVERAVAALIDTVLSGLNLSPNECTLLGGSKGGSAALLFGLKYSYRNVIACVPQTQIGTYTREKLKNTFGFMACDDSELSENTLNSYLPKVVASPSSWSKNVYIVSSKQDPEYAVHIEPLLPELQRFENFNLLLTDSMLVASHPEVTPYNIPFILGTLYHLCDNIAPHFGLVTNGNGHRDRLAPQSDKGIHSSQQLSELHWAQIKGDKLLLAGYAVSIGEEISSRPTTSPSLVFQGQHRDIRVELHSSIDASVNSKLYSNGFIDYRWAGFRPEKSEGISLTHLPEGEYALHAAFSRLDNTEDKTAIRGSKHLTNSSAYAGYNYELVISPLRVTLTKTGLDCQVAPDSFFEFSSMSAHDSKLNISGTFIVPREWMRHWDEGRYFLTMASGERVITFPLATTRLRLPAMDQSYSEGAYTWSHFSTPGHNGIDLEGLAEGDYDCYVTFIRSGNVYTSPNRFRITLETPHQITLKN